MDKKPVGKGKRFYNKLQEGEELSDNDVEESEEQAEEQVQVVVEQDEQEQDESARTTRRASAEDALLNTAADLVALAQASLPSPSQEPSDDSGLHHVTAVHSMYAAGDETVGYPINADGTVNSVPVQGFPAVSIPVEAAAEDERFDRIRQSQLLHHILMARLERIHSIDRPVTHLADGTPAIEHGMDTGDGSSRVHESRDVLITAFIFFGGCWVQPCWLFGCFFMRSRNPLARLFASMSVFMFMLVVLLVFLHFGVMRHSISA